jgi:hypothetical protein
MVTSKDDLLCAATMNTTAHAIDVRNISEVTSVLSRPLDVLDDEHFARGTRGFEFQPKLFL